MIFEGGIPASGCAALCSAIQKIVYDRQVPGQAPASHPAVLMDGITHVVRGNY
jgi:hypothetical protein